MEPKKTVIVKGGELKDHPGWYKLDGRLEDDLNKAFGMVRKPDGTWWRVAGEHYFPPEGGDVRIELGEQITKLDTLDQIEEYYEELLVKLDQKRIKEGVMKEGDRVRVKQGGTTGTILNFGSIPGVPRIVNVAYDGGGGCNHRPDELELILPHEPDFTPR
jgi:hypothetical protein